MGRRVLGQVQMTATLKMDDERWSLGREIDAILLKEEEE